MDLPLPVLVLETLLEVESIHPTAEDVGARLSLDSKDVYQTLLALEAEELIKLSEADHIQSCRAGRSSIFGWTVTDRARVECLVRLARHGETVIKPGVRSRLSPLASRLNHPFERLTSCAAAVTI